MNDRDRTPYPFFCSTEFWTVVVKTLGTLSFAVPAMSKSGFSLETGFIFLGAIAQGFLLSAKELEIHQNLYTNKGVAGRDKSDAIANIVQMQAMAVACKTSFTKEAILESTDPRDFVKEAIIKPTIIGAIKNTVLPKSLRGLF
jgi:hypothetical protein